MEMNPQPDPDQAQSDQPSIMSQNCLDSKYEKTVENMLVAMIRLKKPVWMSIKESECKVLLSHGKTYILMGTTHLLNRKTFKWLEFMKSLTLKCVENRNVTVFCTLPSSSQNWSPAVFRHYIKHY